jgi:hypothetical protein
VIDSDFFREFFILYVGEYAGHRGLFTAVDSAPAE